MCWR